MARQVKIVFFAIAAVLTWAHANAAECSSNETESICGILCEPTCNIPRGHGIICPPLICMQGISSGCRCHPGYSRNDGGVGNCILTTECPQN